VPHGNSAETGYPPGHLGSLRIYGLVPLSIPVPAKSWRLGKRTCAPANRVVGAAHDLAEKPGKFLDGLHEIRRDPAGQAKRRECCMAIALKPAIHRATADAIMG